MPLRMMNLTSSADLPADILFVNFNQDSSSVTVGTRLGYRLFNLGSVDKLEQIHESLNESLDVCLVERLFLSSLVAQVSLSSPRKLKVCHFRKGVEICDYSYSNTILAVKMNRIRLIVVLEDSIYIHDISDMRVLHIIGDTPANTHGVCDLSSSNDNSLLAYPGSRGSGDVQIFDSANLKAVTTIQAHNSMIAAMKFNRDASLLATASDKGTIIRVFSVPSGQKMFEFRRGMKRCVAISSIAFSNDSRFLAVSSNTETVHIFKLSTSPTTSMEDRNNNNSVSGESWMDYMNEMWKKSSTYIPTQVSSMISQDRAFATVRLPFSGLKNVCTLAVIKKLLRVVIASEDGYLYIYNLDPELGGECNFVRQHRLDSQGSSISKPHEISTYASATKGSNTNNNTKLRSDSVEICGSGSSAEYIEKDTKLLPRGKMKNLVDEHELVEDLPLDDDQEFPPMNMFVE